MGTHVLHVDLDQFIAAVEVLRHPELAGRPVIVGGDGDPTKRGVVSTASYEARAFGVRSGMALRTAATRCPEAVFLPVDRAAYEAASADVMDTLRTFPAVVEVAGWDEAYLAVEADDPVELARAIQRAVLERTGLHCSIGVGDNKLRAKLAAGLGKPAGVAALSAANWEQVAADRPAAFLLGIGTKTARRLAALGIRTVGELAAADEEELAAAFGPAIGPWLRSLGRGEDPMQVSDAPRHPRSRGRERTFQQDLAGPPAIRHAVARLARELAADVAAEGRPARRVVVKVRFAPFDTSTHGVTLPQPSSAAGELERAALEALGRFDLDRPVRLLGVRAELVRPAEPPPGDAGSP